MSTAQPRMPGRLQQKWMMSFDFPGKGVVSTGLITCVSNANMADTDFITVSTGMGKPVVYEYDKSANGVTATRVSWAAGSSTAADVAATLKTAINANQTELLVTDNLNGTLTIAQRWPGAGGNITITENVTNVGFLVTGLTGGVDPKGSVLADTTFLLHKIKTRGVRIDRVWMSLPDGLAADASNYCNFKLLKNSAIAANWSTLTGANGTIAPAGAVNFILSATVANRFLADADTMSLFLDLTGTPTVPPGRLVVEGSEL